MYQNVYIAFVQLINVKDLIVIKRNYDAATDMFFVGLFIGSLDIIYAYCDVTCYACARNKSTDRLCRCR